MRLSKVIANLGTFMVAAALCAVAASYAVTALEDRTEIGVRGALDRNDQAWAEIQADGLQVILSGTAPSEAARFDALSTAGAVVDSARIIDEMTVEATADLAPPRFSAEILRNESGISIIGLIPESSDELAVVAQIKRVADGAPVTDLLEVADYPPPRGWQDALDFALSAVDQLPRSKISVDESQVNITAIAPDADAGAALERSLNRAAPPGLRLRLDISAPRPVITPFTLRFTLDDGGAEFDACSADSDEARAEIIAAALAAGLDEADGCVIGLGVPSPRWSEAVVQSLEALSRIGSGTVTLSDANVTLAAGAMADPGLFERVVGELENTLPPAFALYTVEPPAQEGSGNDPTEFVATLSPEGLVQLRGRVTDRALRDLTESYAKAAFGSDRVYTATRVIEDLPANWPVKVLTGLEALAFLSHGSVVVTPGNIAVRGITERKTARADISQLLSSKLGETDTFTLDITYREPPPPEDLPRSPEACEADIALIQNTKKITFEPGEATLAEDSIQTMDAIAEILGACGDLRLEIQGHTDSQGREIMNMELSQARAQSVLNELRARRVLTSSFVAKGYGETQPIADNDTAAGREDNRRIEFKLIRPAPSSAAELSTLDSLAAPLEEVSAENSDQSTVSEEVEE